MAIDPQLINTVRVGELPVGAFELTDKIAHEKGIDLFSGTIEDLINLVRLNSNAFQFEVKYLNVINQYILDNFDGTGLGTNLCLGWAICNGQNGTKNLDGKVLVGYGSTYNVAGVTGGSTTHTLTAAQIPPIQVPYTGSNADNGDPGTLIVTANADSNGVKNLVSSGSGQPHNIMQPYLVTLAIQKI